MPFGLGAGLEALGIMAVAEGVPEFVSKVGQMQSAITQTADASDSLGGQIAALGDKVLSLAQIGLAAAAAGFTALGAAIAVCVREAAEEEVTLARIDQMLINTGRAADFSTEQVQSLAMQYRDQAGGSDDAVLAIEDMALRMGNVTAQEMPNFIQTVLDLSAATGTDAVSAARLLTISMEYPTAALRRFRNMGILVTDETLEQMRAYDEAGNTAAAYGLLLQTISRSTMGQAARRAQTLTGQISILREHIKETMEDIGTEVLPIVTRVLENVVAPFIESWLPRIVEAFETYIVPWIEKAAYVIEALGDAGFGSIEFFEALSGLAPSVADRITAFGDACRSAWDTIKDFFIDHREEIVGAIEAIGVALATAGIISLISKIAAAFSILGGPITILIGAIAALGAAWRGNWFGMRDTITEWWEQTGKPIFDSIVAWVQEKLPIAIAALSDFWTGVLLPAIQTAWGWVEDNVFPILQTLWSWLQEQIPVALQFISDAWTNNFLPVWETFIASMQENVLPLFDQLRAWLAENIPVAIQTLSDFWTNVLQPAIATFWNWCQANVVPRLRELAMWLAENIPVAIRALADFWTGTLLPALLRVWSWMQGTFFPFLGALADFLSATLGYAFRVFAALITNIVWPALQDLWREFNEHIVPVLREILDDIMPVLQGAWETLTRVFQGATEVLHEIADAIRSLELPGWLTPGSPTPFELALKGINEQMDRLTKVNLPSLNYQMTAARMISAPAASSPVTNNYTLNIATSAAAEPIAADFKLLASLRGR